MLGSLTQEQEILTQILAFRDDPVGFVYYAYPWGRPNTPFANIKGPRTWQLEELERIADHVRRAEFCVANGLPVPIWRSAYASGRGPGKTALFGMAANWHMSAHLGSTTTLTANTEAQLRSKTIPEFSVWFNSAINAHWFDIETLRIVPRPWLAELVSKQPGQGGLGISTKYWYVQGQMWSEDNPNAFAGTHNPLGLMLLFDEASGIPTPIWDVAEGFFSDVSAYRFVLAASQRRSKQGRFHELFEDARVGKGWRLRTLSTRGMEGVDQQKIADDIERYGENSDFVRVEIDGLPPATSEDQFVPMDAVRAAQQNELFRDQREPLILGVDPAPRGRTAWRFRQGRNARDCCGSGTHGILEGRDNIEIAEKILELDRKYEPDAICIDFGMGTGVIDYLKRKRPRARVFEVKFGASPLEGKDSEFATLGTELWAKMRAWLPGAMIERDDGGKLSLTDQLTNRGWKWSGREDNKKILETKDDMRKRGQPSPDDADALALTFFVNPPVRGQWWRAGGAARIAEGVEKSPFD